MRIGSNNDLAWNDVQSQILSQEVGNEPLADAAQDVPPQNAEPQTRPDLLARFKGIEQPIVSQGGVQALRNREDPPAWLVDDGSYDLNTPEGSLKMFAKTVENFYDNFVNNGLEERKAALEAALREEYPGFDELGEETPQKALLKKFDDQCRKVVEARSNLLKFVKDALVNARTMLEACVQRDSFERADLEVTGDLARSRNGDLQKAFDYLRRAMRNFKFRYDRANGVGVSALQTLNQTFRNGKLMRFLINTPIMKLDDGLFAVAAKEEKKLVDIVRLARQEPHAPLGQSDFSCRLDEFTVLRGDGARKFSTDIAEIKRGLEAFQDVTYEGFQATSMKSQLSGIAKHGGHKYLTLEGGVGFGFKLFGAEAAVKGKLRYDYRIQGNADGSITVEHALAGGAGAHVRLGNEHVVKGRIAAEAEIGGGLVSKRFRDIDSAVRYMAHGAGGKVNPLFLEGRMGLGTISGFNRFCERVHAKITGRKDPPFSERGFVQRMKNRGLLAQTDHAMRRGRNNLIASERSFLRTSAGVDGEITALKDIAKLSGQAGYRYEHDWHAKTVEYRPYLEHLEAIHAGTENDFFLNDVDENVWPDGVADVKRFLQEAGQRSPAEVRPGVLAQLRTLRQRLDRLESLAARDLRNDPKGFDYKALADKYHAAAAAAAALFRLWEARLDSEAPSAEERQQYRDLRNEVRETLINPGIKFPDDVFKETMMVRADAVKDNRSVHRANIRFEADFTTHLKKLFLGWDALDDAGKSFFSLVGLGRAAIGGVTSGVGSFTTTSSIAADLEVVNPERKDGRPWSGTSRKTVTLRPTHNLAISTLMVAMLQIHLKMNNLPRPNSLDELKAMLKSMLVGGVVMAPLKGLFKEFQNKFFGGASSAYDAVQNANPLADSMLGKFVWNCGRQIQLQYEDDRLVAISLGNHKKIDVRLDIGKVGVVADFGATFDTVSNHSTWLRHPSFNTLARMCDDHLRVGNERGWRNLGTHNREVFAHMFDVVGRTVLDIEPEKADKEEASDRAEFRKMMTRIVEEAGDDPRLQSNLRNLQRAVKRLAQAYAKRPPVDDDLKMRLMRSVFEGISRHYTLLSQPTEPPVEQVAQGDARENLVIRG